MKLLSLLKSLFIVIFCLWTWSISCQEITNDIGISAIASLDYGHIKKNDKGEYFILMETTRSEIEVGSETILIEDFPLEYGEQGLAKQVLIKLNPKFELENYVLLVGRMGEKDFCLSNDRVFVGFTRSGNYYFMANDVVLTPNTSHRGIVLEYDHDLNYIDTPFTIQQPIEHVSAYGDSTLYVNALLDGRDTMVFNQDTLTHYDYQGTTYSTTNTVINYNYKAKKVDHFWKFGTASYDYTNEMACDSNGDIILTGYMDGVYITFDNQDTILDYSGVFLVKYKPDGTLDWYNLNETAEAQSRWLKVLDDNIYVIYNFSRTLNLDGNPINTWVSEDFESVGNNKALVKYDIEGNHLWTYIPRGMNMSNLIYEFENKNDTLEVLGFVDKSDSLYIQDDLYLDLSWAPSTIFVDNMTGEELGGHIDTSHTFSLTEHYYVNYVEKSEEGNREVRNYRIRNSVYDFFGQEFVSEDGSSEFLIELNGEVVSNTKNLKKSKELFSLFPNPILSNELLQLELSDVIKGELTVYSQLGEQVLSQSIRESVTSLSIETKGLNPGPYLVHLISEGHYQSQLVLIK